MMNDTTGLPKLFSDLHVYNVGDMEHIQTHTQNKHIKSKILITNVQKSFILQ